MESFALIVAACALAGAAGVCLGRLIAGAVHARPAKQSRAAAQPTAPGVGGMHAACLGYMADLSQKLSLRATGALSKRVPFRRSRASFNERACMAGLKETVSAQGYCEAVVRLALAGGATGGLVGAVASNELMLIGAAAGAVLGARAPGKAVEAARRARALSLERSLSEMLEVVALGVRSGLSFERSMQLYVAHFDDALARECASALQAWTAGMATRGAALRALAASYDSPLLTRTIAAITRSLRFGTSLGDVLEQSALEARAQRRAHVEERVAKAPVKMMIPTGTLILPAMLLLVLGPVLLELMEGM